MITIKKPEPMKCSVCKKEIEFGYASIGVLKVCSRACKSEAMDTYPKPYVHQFKDRKPLANCKSKKIKLACSQKNKAGEGEFNHE